MKPTAQPHRNAHTAASRSYCAFWPCVRAYCHVPDHIDPVRPFCSLIKQAAKLGLDGDGCRIVLDAEPGTPFACFPVKGLTWLSDLSCSMFPAIAPERSSAGRHQIAAATQAPTSWALPTTPRASCPSCSLPVALVAPAPPPRDPPAPTPEVPCRCPVTTLERDREMALTSHADPECRRANFA